MYMTFHPEGGQMEVVWEQGAENILVWEEK
jgi:hypothetical protein